MNNVDETLKELEEMLAREAIRKAEAQEAQKKAEGLKAAAIEEQKKAAEAQKSLAEAKLRLEEARAALDSVKGYERVIVEEPVVESKTYVVRETPNDTETETVVVKETRNDKSGSGKFAVGFISGALVLALLGTGAWILSKEAKKGVVKSGDLTVGATLTEVTPIPAPTVIPLVTPTPTVVPVVTPEPTVAPVETPVVTVAPTPELVYNYNYNYGDNVVTVDTTTTTIDNGVVVGTETEVADYKVLTTEEFEALTAEVMTTLKKHDIKVSSEDVIKYVMIRNIDKLRQDNNELITTIIGKQNVDEVFADADQVIDAIMTYNLLYFDKHQDTKGFISASLGVFDETQKARVLEIEKRVYEIGANLKDNKKVNELTYKLLKDMINPTNEISELEDGVSYGVQFIDMYMVRATFGTNKYGELNKENADLVKYFVSFAGDGKEYEDNAIVNGNYRNILALLKECAEVKGRSK